jgi:dTDP-4-dehydrorhamnose reductase
MSRVLILGADGQLGQDLTRVLRRHHELFTVDLPQCDITEAAQVRAVCESFWPDVIVNCAAHTGVDACEREVDRAMAINGMAVRNLAEVARERRALLVQISTDYVFDGRARRPYCEDDPVNPLSVYGQSKLAGERAALALGDQALIVRTQWLYGPGERNFVYTILRRAQRGEPLSVVDDQRGSPTYTLDLAHAIEALLLRGCRGLYHAANAGEATWLEFAWAILNLTGLSAPLSPCATDLRRYPAPRPAYAVLSTEKLERDTGHRMRPWKDALIDYLRRYGLLRNTSPAEG